MYKFNIGDEVVLVPTGKETYLFGTVGKVIDKYKRGYFVSYTDPITGDPFQGAFSIGELLSTGLSKEGPGYRDLVDRATYSELYEDARFKIASRINREFPDMDWNQKQELIVAVTSNILDELGLVKPDDL